MIWPIKRVIHFADWNEKSVGDQFGRWLAYAICEAVQGRGTQQRITQMQMKTTQMPKWKKLMTKSGWCEFWKLIEK
jgi:hypothetical protein